MNEHPAARGSRERHDTSSPEEESDMEVIEIVDDDSDVQDQGTSPARKNLFRGSSNSEPKTSPASAHKKCSPSKARKKIPA